MPGLNISDSTLGNFKASEVLQRVAKGLLRSYVRLCADSVSPTVVNGIRASCRDVNSVEVSNVSPYVISTFTQLLDIRDFVKAIIDTDSDKEQLPLELPGYGESRSYVRSNKIVQNTSHIQKDIERMFEKKIEIVANISFKTDSVIEGVLRFILKAFIENMRLETFTSHEFQQLEVDIYFSRVVVPLLVENTSTANALLSQMMKTAESRCVQVSHVKSADLESIARSGMQKLSL